VATRAAGRPASRWMLVLLLVSITVGGAAALLSGPTPVLPSVGPGQAQSLAIPLQIAGIVVVAAFFGVFALTVWQGRGHRAEGMWGIPVAAFVAAFLVAVLVVAVGRYVAPGGLGSNSVPANNSSSGSGSTSPAGGGGNGSLLPLGSTPFGGLVIPGWVLVAGLVVAAIVVAVIVVPFAQSLAVRLPPPPPEPPPTRRAFETALAALDDPAHPDVRAIVIALYATLLGRVERSIGATDRLSPREIEAECVRTLHLGPDSARELTRLFEEARYSTHPLDAAVGERARRALASALADLDRAPGAA